MKLIVPLPDNIANARMHWRPKLNAKKAYWNALDLWLAMKRLPKPPAQPMERAEARVTLYVWNIMDEGNAMARLKWLEDWLVGARYLVDDSRKHLKYAGIPEQVIDRRNPRIEIELTPLPAA